MTDPAGRPNAELAQLLARRVADAAVAWLADPRDTRAYAALVDAAKRYREWRDPALPIDLSDQVEEIAHLARITSIGDMLAGDLPAVVDGLRRFATTQTNDTDDQPS